MTRANPVQRAARPIVFDDDHIAGNISQAMTSSSYKRSKHHAVADGLAGPYSMTITLHNTPEVRAILLEALAAAQTDGDFIQIAARHRVEKGHRPVPRRLIVHVGDAA
jgi:hypothetical protein